MQIRRHHHDWDVECCVMVVWSLSALHAPGLGPDLPTTSALVTCLNRHLPALHAPHIRVVHTSLRTVYRRLRGRPLQWLVRGLEARARALGLHLD